MSKALLLIDIQNDYFEGGKSELFEPEKALGAAEKVLDMFRENGLPVIHVQHINTREGATFFLPNTDGAKIHERLTPHDGESVIVKHAPNSFFDTNLNGIITDKQVSELVVCGMMTHMCVDTTVRAAKDYGIPVTLVHDACATKDLLFNGEKLSANVIQKAYLAGLNGMFAKIIAASELRKP
ncbi:MAG: cysteine hydrolase [Betaproteobacteria bacterium]|nr:cysteine hydrolase [Betaproteobacteria bacterium]